MRELPERPDLDQLRRQARELQRAAARGDSHALERLHAVALRPTLTAARLATAREYGFPSWAQLKAEIERRNADTGSGADGHDIRPVASLAELAEAFDVIAAQFVPGVTHDNRRFRELAARFADDRRIMLIVEHRGHIVGGALAYRRGRNGGLGATLRMIGLVPGARGRGLGRRLVQTLELEAMRLGVVAINLGGAAGEIKGFYTRMGYTGRGSMMSKGLPLSSSFVEARLQKPSGA